MLATAAGAAPAPQTCPSVAPVFCDAGCCGGGTSCGDAGNCAASSSAAACPSEAPVVCSTPVDCGAGCVAIDSSGNSRNFFLAPPAQFVPGKYGTGVSIRGASGCPLDLITSDAGLSDPLTIELWIRNDGGATGQVIYNHGPDRVLSQTGSTLYWADNGVGLTSYAPINDGTWHFVAATAAPRALFVDGVLRGTNPTSAVPADAGIVLGGTCNTSVTPNSPFTGDIDEMRILSYAADGGQIASDFDAGRLTAIPGTLGLWHFDEGDSPRCCPSGSTCDNGGCDGGPALAPAGCGGGNGSAGFYCQPGEVCPGGSCGSGCALPGDGGICPDSSQVPCAGGICCAAGQVCIAGGLFCNPGGCNCRAPTCADSLAGGNVNGGFPKVCSPACPAGTTCSNGYCATQDIAMDPCGNGTPCGANCCLQGEACTNGACAASPVGIACPADHPVQCGANGPCCPAGFSCSGGACVAPLASTHTGPQGPPCANGYCDTGLSCGGGALCCPPSLPLVCGGTCCAADETCSNGQCGCPAGETSCGTACCPSGSVCKNGACEPACANGEFCGGFCCTAPNTCKNGACSCPDDHPVQCGGACCLPGGTCFDSVDCNCPPGRAACGLDCCAIGDVCTGGVCGAPSSGGGGTGFDGTYAGTCVVTGQLGSGTTSARITFQNGIAVSGLGNGATGTVDAAGHMTLKFVDSCGVSFSVSGTASTSGTFTLSGGNTNDLQCATQDDT
ncbi:MAG: LamG domain-containing protein, partial [Deltaproteobacteria bacterium]